MYNLLLGNYNNYFNRIVKRENTYTQADNLPTVQGYINHVTNAVTIQNINFNPEDGITTKVILGKGDYTAPESNSPLQPDYAVLYETEDDLPNDGIVKSRWFVIEAVRTRSGQYELSLKRDVVVDNYDKILNSPCFIEKGIIDDTQNPLLLNPENMSFNQIKQGETPIIDESGSAWLVGYLKKDLAAKSTQGVMSKDLEQAYSADSLFFKDFIDYDDDSDTPTQSLVVPSALNIKFYTKFGTDSYGQRLYFKGDLNSNVYSYLGYQLGQTWEGLNSNLLGRTQTSRVPEQLASIFVGKWNEAVNNTIPEATKTSFKNYISGSIKTATNIREVSDVSSSESYSSLVSKYNNAFIIKDGVYYKLSIYLETATRSANNYYDYQSSNIVGTYVDYLTIPSYNLAKNETVSAMNKIRGTIEYQRIVVQALKQDTTANTITMTIPAVSDRFTTEDALYDVFALPFIPSQYPDKVATFKDTDGTVRTVNSEAMLFIVQKFMKERNMGQSSAEAYDLQILPYCPITMPADNDLRELDAKSYSLITQGEDNTPIGYIVYASKSNFTKNIPLVRSLSKAVNQDWNYVNESEAFTSGLGPLSTQLRSGIHNLPVNVIGTENKVLSTVLKINGELVENYRIEYSKLSIISGDTFRIYLYKTDFPDTGNYSVDLTFNLSVDTPYSALEIKIKNETDFMRLTSPNFNSMFEFKLTKFNQGMKLINIDCTYKPQVPYIKLNPDFSGLYGHDWNDSTGLILSGDFSLPVMNDAWINYQMNNKNYQAIFNRQIQNLDVNSQIALEQQQFNAAIGVLGGAIGGGTGGAVAGAKIGGPYGAAAGAILGFTTGAALSSIGAAKDRDWLMRSQAETRSYAKDQFNYQLGNIKALPQSISKSDPLTYNNKIWPILEEFSCTDKEKELFRNKIEYNGMNIMAVDMISNYINSTDFDKVYIKGQLIRLEDINDDFHVAEAIYDEINKGLYIKGE